MGGRFIPDTIRHPGPGEHWVVNDRHPDVERPVLGVWDGQRWDVSGGTGGLHWHEWENY